MTSERATTSRRLARLARSLSRSRAPSVGSRESREVPRGERGEDGDTRLLTQRRGTRGGGGEPRFPVGVREDREGGERGGEDVRSPDDARHRLGPHGVRGEERGGEPREGSARVGVAVGEERRGEAKEETVGEQDGEGVEDDVEGVEAERAGAGRVMGRRPVVRVRGRDRGRGGLQAADRGVEAEGEHRQRSPALVARVARQVLAPVVVAPERRGAARGTVVPLGGRGIRREGGRPSPSLARRRARPRWTRRRTGRRT